MTPTATTPDPAPAPVTTPDKDLSWGGRSSMAAFAMSGTVYVPRGLRPVARPPVPAKETPR